MKSIWIARDKGGALFLFTKKPSRFEDIWNNKSEDGISECCRIPDEWFPNLRWGDEPVELVIKEKKIHKTCSNCLYFKDEAIDGTGICHAFNTEHFYNNEGCYDWEEKED